jgi:hypothetical protein
MTARFSSKYLSVIDSNRSKFRSDYDLEPGEQALTFISRSRSHCYLDSAYGQKTQTS